MPDINDPGYRDYLRRAYIDPEPSLEVAAIQAEADQHVLTLLEIERACERYNGDKLVWLTNEIPTELRQLIDGVLARLNEAKARDSRHAPRGPRVSDVLPEMVWWDDGRSKYDEMAGWKPFDPDNPHHSGVGFGTIVAEQRLHVYVLRGGTDKPVVPRDMVATDDDVTWDLPDYGPGWNFADFMREAEKVRMPHLCDAALPNGCAKGIGGGTTRLVAVPRGQHVFAVNICADCTKALRRSVLRRARARERDR